jgi:hypothetical protein
MIFFSAGRSIRDCNSAIQNVFSVHTKKTNRRKIMIVSQVLVDLPVPA